MALYDDQNELKSAEGVVGINPYSDPSVTQVRPLGEQVMIGERCYRYVSTAVDIEAGEIAGHVAGTVIMSNACTAAAIGATTVVIDDAGISSTALDAYRGGYLFITDDVGQGHSYRIKSNSVSVVNVVTFTLYDAILVALTTTSDTQVLPSQDSLVVLGTAALRPVGVATSQFTAGTDSTVQYGWIQTTGPSCVLITTATTIAIGLELGVGSAGGVVIKTANIAKVGVALSAAENAAGFQPCYLQLG